MIPPTGKMEDTVKRLAETQFEQQLRSIFKLPPTLLPADLPRVKLFCADTDVGLDGSILQELVVCVQDQIETWLAKDKPYIVGLGTPSLVTFNGRVALLLGVNYVPALEQNDVARPASPNPAREPAASGAVAAPAHPGGAQPAAPAHDPPESVRLHDGPRGTSLAAFPECRSRR